MVSRTGKEIRIKMDSIAAHGDSPIAIELARGLVNALRREGVELAPVGTFL